MTGKKPNKWAKARLVWTPADVVVTKPAPPVKPPEPRK